MSKETSAIMYKIIMPNLIIKTKFNETPVYYVFYKFFCVFTKLALKTVLIILLELIYVLFLRYVLLDFFIDIKLELFIGCY